MLLVGGPSQSVLDNLLARAWMLAIGTGSPCLIVDCGGLVEAGEKSFDVAYQKFLEQVEGSAIQVLRASGRNPSKRRIAPNPPRRAAT